MRRQMIGMAALAAVLGWTAGPAAGAVDLGDTAPALQIAQWVKGQPMALKDGLGKTIFVVEFWATWCPPCKTSIPHLSKLQKQYADQGVVVIGISDEPVDTVKPFVEQHKRMDYRVACDDGEKTGKTWREPRSGIPYAFVVDKRGVVAWAGHPMAMDRALKKAVAGTLDPKIETRKRQVRQRALMAAQQSDADNALQALDQFIALDRDDPEGYRLKTLIFDATDKADSAAAVRLEMVQRFTDDTDVLLSLAAQYATAEDLAQRAPERALDLALRAVRLTQEQDAGALDTLASVYYALCRIDQAVETERKAVALVEEEDKTRAEAALAFYLKIQKLGTTAKP